MTQSFADGLDRLAALETGAGSEVVPQGVTPVLARRRDASRPEGGLPDVRVEVVPVHRLGLAAGDRQTNRDRRSVRSVPRNRHGARGVPREVRRQLVAHGRRQGHRPHLSPLQEGEVRAVTGGELDLSPHLDRAAEEVDVIGGEAEHLALSQPRPRRQGRNDAVAVRQRIARSARCPITGLVRAARTRPRRRERSPGSGPLVHHEDQTVLRRHDHQTPPGHHRCEASRSMR